MSTRISTWPGEHLIERLKNFPAPWCARAGIVHFWPAQRSAGNFRGHGRRREQADLTFAQFVMMSPYPGTVDFNRWEKGLGETRPPSEEFL